MTSTVNGAQIREARERAGLTQQELATRLGGGGERWAHRSHTAHHADGPGHGPVDRFVTGQ